MVGDLLNLFYWRCLTPWMARAPRPMIAAVARSTAALHCRLRKLQKFLMGSELVACGLATPESLVNGVRQGFRTHFSGWLQMSILRIMTRDNVRKLIPLQGEEYLIDALKEGKGAILLNPHFGPFLMAIAAISYRGYATSQVAAQGTPPEGARRGLKEAVYRAKVSLLEDRMPATFINIVGRTMVVRDVLKALGHNQVVLFASTGRGGTAWAPVPLLGRQSLFSPTVFRIAQKAASPVLPLFVMVGEDQQITVRIEPPLSNAGGDPEAMLREYVAVLERHVTDRPDHFAKHLLDMRFQAGWDDHPFFTDYPPPPPDADRPNHNKPIGSERF